MLYHPIHYQILIIHTSKTGFWRGISISRLPFLRFHICCQRWTYSRWLVLWGLELSNTEELKFQLWFDYPSCTSWALEGFLRLGNRVQPTLVYEMNLKFPKVKQPVLSTRSSNNPEFGNDDPRLSHWSPCMVKVSAWYIEQCKEARDRQALWGITHLRLQIATCQQTHSKINGAQ
jgi:hypothetical protein